MPESSKKLLTSTGRVQRWSSECTPCAILFVVCVGGVEGCAWCWLGSVHNWDGSCPEQVLACACTSMKGLVKGIFALANANISYITSVDWPHLSRPSCSCCQRSRREVGGMWVLTELSSGTGGGVL